MHEDGKLVVPGEIIATEEEFIPGENTYAEDGNIFASVSGRIEISGNKISVINNSSGLESLKRGMPVVGRIVNDLHTIMFVELSKLSVGSRRYIPFKDGKILLSSSFRLHDSHDSYRRQSYERKPSSPYKVGDFILAEIKAESADTYELDLYKKEFGVISAECSVCGNELSLLKDGVLVCPVCGNKEYRKTSIFYDKPDLLLQFLSSYFSTKH
ncbi:MAG: exosome complex RNA-binding protein Csl4 [Candidatus Micrarchaeia archaeon]